MRQALSKKKRIQIYARIANRYDVQHAFLTAKANQKGRELLVHHCVQEGNKVLDCGSGTGTTALMAARKVGSQGKVTCLDHRDAMLVVAKHKITQAGLQDRVVFQSGDMVHLPFENNSFDVVLSTYSLCPLYDPKNGALELYRVTKPGGKLGVAHSTQPKHRMLKYLAGWIEDFAWRLPGLSMGCRSVQVLETLKNAGGNVLLSRQIGVPLWPFQVFVIEKPSA